MSSCAHPEHRHQTTELVADASAHCLARGLRLTPLRKRVLELVADSHGPAKAYDLLDQLRGVHDGAAPPTVYRALDFLLEHGFVHKVESINAYVACPHPGGTHTAQFLVCDRCGSAVELDSAELPSLLASLARERHFAAERLVVEVHGTCSACIGSV